MIKNRYNRIPHPVLNTKRERDTYSYDIKTAQEKSQGDSSFPIDVHKAIQHKLNSKSKTNKNGRTLTISTHHLRTLSNKLLGGLDVLPPPYSTMAAIQNGCSRMFCLVWYTLGIIEVYFLV